MFRKKGSRKFDPARCPNCNSARVILAGEVKDGVQPMQCQNCRERYDIINEPVGLVIRGNKIPVERQATSVSDTQKILWFEVRRQDKQLMQCGNPECREHFKSLYTRAACPEDAAKDPHPWCWDCAQVETFFPANETIEIPQVWI